MHDEKLFNLVDSVSDLREAINGICCYVDLLLSAYAEPPADRIVKTASVSSVERLQYNLFTLYDLIMKLLEDAETTEGLADEILESSK